MILPRIAIPLLILALCALASPFLSGCESIKQAVSISPADPALEQVMILEELENRQVRLTENASKYTSYDDEFYVCVYAPNGVTLKTINDAHTGKPLKARILETFLGSPRAVIQGMRPLGSRLEGALLTRQLPEDSVRQRMADVDSAAPKNYPAPTG